MSSDYRAYLLRFRRQPSAAHWRATLENVHSRELLHFATERELLVYLLGALSEQPASSGANPCGPTEIDE